MTSRDSWPIAAVIQGEALVRPVLPPQPLAWPEGFGGGSCLAYACVAQPHLGYVAPAVARRMTRLQLLILTAAHQAVARAGSPIAGLATGVFVGSHLGSIGTTIEFLSDLIRRDEASPMPAKFIASVHNAAASALALEFQCRGENRTTIHDSISFELALKQALTSLRAGRTDRTLVAAGDELNAYYVAAMNRCRPWRTSAQPLAPLSPTDSGVAGSLPGEGAAALVLARPGADQASQAPVYLRNFALAPRADAAHAGALPADGCVFLRSVLRPAGATLDDVNLLLLAADGDAPLDAAYRHVAEAAVAASGGRLAVAVFKHLCGEFATASALGLTLAADAVRRRAPSPDLAIIQPGPAGPLAGVLTYTIHHNGFHSAGWVTS
jgi:3-oxoacyl-(acyl-carrier-protein) synthase